MIYKEHTRNQKRMYRIHKMEEQIEKDKYIIGNQQEEIEKLKLELSGYRQAILQDKEMLGLKQENERLHSIIKEVREETEKQLKGAICQEFTDLKVILRILDKENK